MNYMLLIYLDEAQMPPMRDKSLDDACGGLIERLAEKGKYVAAGILQQTPTARSVRLRAGHRQVTDGPFAETREQLAGYVLVEADSFDEAVAMAAEHPVAQFGTVEVRPLLHIPSVGVPIAHAETA
jgi:hypothetical protein